MTAIERFRPQASASPRDRPLLTATAPALVWAAGRLVGLLVLALVAQARDRSMLSALTSWDGQFFLRIAGNGYPPVPSGLTGGGFDTSMAFFAGYPLTARWLGWLLGVGVRPAAFVVTGLAGLALAFGLVALARALGHSRRVGLLWVGLVGASPLSVVFLMTYTEPLFCALAVWALVAVIRWQWGWAALAAVGAGWTRPTGIAVVIVVMVGALLEGWRSAGRRRIWCWTCAAIAPLGMLGYLGFVAFRTGALTGWFRIQSIGWQTRIDGGAATWSFVRGQLAGPWSLMEAGTVLVVLSVPLLIWAAIRSKLPWPILVYSLVVAAMAVLSAGVMNSKIRMLLPALPLLLPIAIGLSRLRTSTQVTTVALATVLASWFGAYCLVIYTHAI